MFKRLISLAAVLALYANCAAGQTLSGSSLASPWNNGSFQVEKGPRWILVSSQSGTQAFATRAAGIAGVRHVVDCVSFSAVSAASVTASNQSFQVLDGATVIYQIGVTFPAAAAAGIQTVPPFGVCGLALAGTPATAMTVEFTTGVVGAIQTLSASGYDVVSP